ncbi:Unknown protein sequence [Pseudomonas amygdali pv. lachrymans]|uniref:Uncharacterized protein n=1 Tax=Pseudomonas amygdali pv. lachrymans TaxID=53707 RepID=A0ABR5KR54_PSEAV|nr:Unknown protein sequence [Pseudomonas amygdali pv. lachrymans]KPC18145.1 Unknown protein sequence [Pseudomonas amygdali pv. lachrymans]RMT06331.1 hypothetical protein ALP54_102762 [Pseudomonas amygdali pv. lachrymans]
MALFNVPKGYKRTWPFNHIAADFRLLRVFPAIPIKAMVNPLGIQRKTHHD